VREREEVDRPLGCRGYEGPKPRLANPESGNLSTLDAVEAGRKTTLRFSTTAFFGPKEKTFAEQEGTKAWGWYAISVRKFCR